MLFRLRRDPLVDARYADPTVYCGQEDLRKPDQAHMLSANGLLMQPKKDRAALAIFSPNRESSRTGRWQRPC
jgi:hypothetical protein